jgi:hypothetical protein
MKYTLSQLRNLKKDEEEASEDYKKHGYLSLAKDEAKHKFFISKEIERRTKK